MKTLILLIPLLFVSCEGCQAPPAESSLDPPRHITVIWACPDRKVAEVLASVPCQAHEVAYVHEQTRHDYLAAVLHGRVPGGLVWGCAERGVW